MKTKIFKHSAVALAITPLISLSTFGAVLTVNSTEDNTTAGNSLCTLREAVVSVNTGVQNTDCSAAAPGSDDQIVFAPNITDSSTISLSAGGIQLEIVNGVTITGPVGEDKLTVSALNTNRVFSIDLLNAPDGDAVTINNLNITGASLNSGGGGGILIHNSQVTINNCDISGNFAYGYGGGVGVNDDSTVEIVDSTISGNYAYSGGGVSADFGSTVSITNSPIKYNTATLGGGIYIRNSSVAVSGYGSTIAYNQSYLSGGGVFVLDGTLTLSDRAQIYSSNAGSHGGGVFLDESTLNLNTGAYLFNNVAFGFGGGIDVDNSTVVIQDALVNNNTTSYYNGGGLSVRGSASSVTIERSTIESNRAHSYFGGGVYVSDGLVTVSDSSISGNIAGEKGGGIMGNNSGSVTLANSTMVGNFATGDGGGINLYQVSGTTYAKIANSIISGNFSVGAGIEIMADGGPTIVSNGMNVFGESNETVAQAIYGFTPPASDIVANSDGNTPTALEQIVGTRVIGVTQRYYPLVAGSPAIALADPSLCSDLDQNKDNRDLEFFVPITAANGNTTVVDLGSGKCDAGATAYNAN